MRKILKMEKILKIKLNIRNLKRNEHMGNINGKIYRTVLLAINDHVYGSVSQKQHWHSEKEGKKEGGKGLISIKDRVHIVKMRLKN